MGMAGLPRYTPPPPPFVSTFSVQVHDTFGTPAQLDMIGCDWIEQDWTARVKVGRRKNCERF